ISCCAAIWPCLLRLSAFRCLSVFPSSCLHLTPHPFPTRRSSDLSSPPSTTPSRLIFLPIPPPPGWRLLITEALISQMHRLSMPPSPFLPPLPAQCFARPSRSPKTAPSGWALHV